MGNSYRVQSMLGIAMIQTVQNFTNFQEVNIVFLLENCVFPDAHIYQLCVYVLLNSACIRIPSSEAKLTKHIADLSRESERNQPMLFVYLAAGFSQFIFIFIYLFNYYFTSLLGTLRTVKYMNFKIIRIIWFNIIRTSACIQRNQYSDVRILNRHYMLQLAQVKERVLFCFTDDVFIHWTST